MGIFNFFIVIPEILASLFSLVAAALMQRVTDAGDEAVHRFGAEPGLQTLVAK